MSVENILWLSGFLTKAVFIAVLVRRRAWRAFPVFCTYCVWDFLLDPSNYLVLHRFASSYLTVYVCEVLIDSILQFSVLVELGWSVLKPIRASLPRGALIVVGGVVLALGAAIWPFSDVNASLSNEGHLLMHLLQTVAILRVFFFLALAAGSQLLSLSWKDRELQVATGLGIYSLVSLGVAMLHTHEASAAQNAHWNEFVTTGYLLSLLYWVVSFAQKEAQRREFTPQMQNLLLAMAGVARADRAALTRSSVTEDRNRTNQ
jgi:hypothetical protein